MQSKAGLWMLEIRAEMHMGFQVKHSLHTSCLNKTVMTQKIHVKFMTINFQTTFTLFWS